MFLYKPQTLYIDRSVADLPLTRRVIHKLSSVPIIWLEDAESAELLKEPMAMTEAKKNLFITRHRGESIKSCQGLGDYVCCNLMTVSFVSNCPMECSYCILQDYLKNNPMITLYANTDEILEGIQEKLDKNPNQEFRLATGELSDSLFLDDLTELSKELIPFVAKQKNLILELRTKSNKVTNLLNLDHQGKTVVSWSVNPDRYIALEEHKTASLDERLAAAQQVAKAGYKIGLHFDPILCFADWELEYENLIKKIASKVLPNQVAWISMGTLRFTPGLKAIATERFPKTQIFSAELLPSFDGKTRYLRQTREEIYSKMRSWLNLYFEQTPPYLCMETKTVWQNTFDFVPQSLETLETSITRHFTV